MNGITKLAFDIGTWLIPLTIAIVFHEVAHGAVAKWFGDMTASERGRLSLNPIRHVDPLGTVILPLILAVSGAPVFGWAKPVPVVPQRMRNPRWNMVAVAAAGPATNIILALVAMLALVATLPALAAAKGSLVGDFLSANLLNFVAINLFLAVFNMLPIPPFDGSKVLAGILPPPLGSRFSRLDRYALPILILLLVILPQFVPAANVLPKIVLPPVEVLYETMFNLASSLFGG